MDWHRSTPLEDTSDWLCNWLWYSKAKNYKASSLPCARIWECSGCWVPLPWCLMVAAHHGLPGLCLLSFVGPASLWSSFKPQGKIFVLGTWPKVKPVPCAQCSKINLEEIGVTQLLSKQRFKFLGTPPLLVTSLLLSPLDSCSLTIAVLWTGTMMACCVGAGRLWQKLHLWKRPLFHLPCPSLELWQQNSIGELTMSLSMDSTDYAPGMTNISLAFFFLRIKSGEDLKLSNTTQLFE